MWPTTESKTKQHTRSHDDGPLYESDLDDTDYKHGHQHIRSHFLQALGRKTTVFRFNCSQKDSCQNSLWQSLALLGFITSPPLNTTLKPAARRNFNSMVIPQLCHYAYKHQNDRDTYLLPLKYAYNVQLHRSIKMPPFRLVLTRVPCWTGHRCTKMDQSCYR